jgi:hypothetical protein
MNRVLLVAGVSILAGCTTAETAAPAAQLQVVAQGQTASTTVTLLAAAPLRVGWQTVHYRVSQDGKPVTQAALQQQLRMQMAAHGHACPLADPATAANAEGHFVAALGPQMASGDAMVWSLAVDVTPVGGTAARVELGTVAVAAAPWMKSLLAAGTQDERYVIGLDLGRTPGLGKQAYALTLHRASGDLMTYVPVDDATWTIDLTMPSMGHGSAGNTAPIAQGGGRYQGALNLTMPGDWRLTATVRRNGQLLGSVVFDWMM